MIAMNTTTYCVLLPCARSCAKYLTYIISLNPYKTLRGSTMTFPILQVRRLGFRVDK